MKKLFTIGIGLALGLGACNTSASEEPAVIGVTTTAYKPVLMNRDDLEASFKVEGPRAMRNLGKIYTKDNYIFISERYEGVHIINNTDPENPVQEKFIVVLGCLDMAMKSNILYVDNAVDLLAINVGDLSSITLEKRVENVLPEPFPPDYNGIPNEYSVGNRPENTVLVSWYKD